jgi:hypothetical protein
MAAAVLVLAASGMAAGAEQGLLHRADDIKAATAAMPAKDKSYSPYANRAYPTRPYFGDTHHHTANSGDAFFNGDRLGPEEAYRFARGEQVTSSTGIEVKLSRPMDFLVVSDHAEGLGVGFEVYNGNEKLVSDPAVKRWSDMLKAGGKQAADATNELISAQAQGTLPKPLTDPVIVGPLLKTVWQAYTATTSPIWYTPN